MLSLDFFCICKVFFIALEIQESNNKHTINDEIPTYLSNIFKKKRLVKSAVIKRYELSEVTSYQIFSDPRKPSCDSLISIYVPIELNIYETQKMLRVAQFTLLYPRVKRDCVIINGTAAKQTVAKTNEGFYDNAEPKLNQ